MYAELHAHSYFSLLDGTSSPEALVVEAKRLGLFALALTDTNSMAGAVRFWQAARQADLQPIFGAVITLDDESQVTLLAETQRGYRNLCQSISAARMEQLASSPSLEDGHELWVGKVAPKLSLLRLAAFREGIICLTGGRKGAIARDLLQHDFVGAISALKQLKNIFAPSHLFLELHNNFEPYTNWLNQQLFELSNDHGIGCVATGNVFYAQETEADLRDCFRAIEHNLTLTQARRAGHLPLNHSFALCTTEEMQVRFYGFPEAITNSFKIAKRCLVDLDFSQQRFPRFDVKSGRNEFSELNERCNAQLKIKYPNLNHIVTSRLSNELAVIEEANLGGFFLHVAEIMAEARRRGIRGQGRGSAGNSIITYLLDITPIDPMEHGLLFERFLSSDRFTAPDIDIDFDTNRRDELIEFIYNYFGRDHVAMVCNVITYRARSAIRDLGKALGMRPSETTRLSRALDTHSPSEAAIQLEAQIPEGASAQHPLRLLCNLLCQIDGAPRHLGIHNGGLLITAQPLAQIVPMEPATMPGRVVVQWDKDSVEDCGLIKLDILGLRALNVVTDALAAIGARGDKAPDFASLSLNDQSIYRMIHSGDTIGASQVESRAQMGFGPRLKPTRFTELMMQVAIVRPGPIQAGSVNPLLRRRAGKEAVTYAHPSLEDVLHDTYGVLLYQEQAIKIAMVAAGFSAGEADMLRRALAREEESTIFGTLQQRFLSGAAQQGIPERDAIAIYQQLAGFAGYGFCKSHAGSLALVAYQNLWLKKYHPGPFYLGILNNAPMGFYSDEVIINDAKRHGVEILPPDINASEFRHALHRSTKGKDQIRIGLNAINGIGTRAWAQIEPARMDNPFTNLNDFAQRTRVAQDVLENLIIAGAFDSFGPRRRLLWEMRQLDLRANRLELSIQEPAIELPDLGELERVVWEYEMVGYSSNTQIMELYRPYLRQHKILSSWELKQTKLGKRVLVAGMSIVVQRPQTAKGVTFQSLEDESGTIDLVIKPNLYERYRKIIRGGKLIVASGLVQREAGATNLVVGWMGTLV